MKNVSIIIFSFIFFTQHFNPCYSQISSHPNVIIILTDDQGYGDLGITGNPNIKTPVIDNLARRSIRFDNFYVCPVCAPTRSSLMTGRYSLRTGIRDTYNGGAIMSPDEITIAEMLKQVGYTTGIFGKWHLGDNYPSRPIDQGFDESLVHLSGGMGQVGDFTTWFKGDSSYFDPVLWHNGKQEAYTGYCSDIFASHAIEFIENHHNKPFFCYLAFNAPHVPLQVPDSYYQRYKNIDPTAGFENDSRPFPKMSEKDREDARKVYAMVNNIDDNIGKLLDKLKSLKLTDNTILIFLTDNGPQQKRYKAGMRGLKGDVYRGGVRVPMYFSYPAKYNGNKDIETTAAHIDILPTLAEICNAKLPSDRIIDGKSLVPLLIDQPVSWSGRPLFFYWTRNYPERYYNIGLLQGMIKLVGKTDYNAPTRDFELYNISEDPYEQRNIIKGNLTLASDLKYEMDTIYTDLISSGHLVNPPRIVIGSENENPIFLNRNDAGGERGIWAQEEIYGKWRVRINEGHYNFRFKFIKPVEGEGKMYLELNTMISRMANHKSQTDMIEMKNIHFSSSEGDLIPYYMTGHKTIFPFWVEIEKID